MPPLRITALLLASLSLASCSFDEDAGESAPNTCQVTSDCAVDLTCQIGVCVMRSTDAPLDVTLEVTPQRMPDGSQPLPILYGPFGLQSGPRTFDLAAPATVTGRVHEGASQVSAQLTFVPTKAPPSLAKPIQARAGLATSRDSFTVQLLAGVEYRLTVQPNESALPPYTRVFVAEDGLEISIDYEQLPDTTLSFVMRGAPPEQRVNIKARAKDGNQIISNTYSSVTSGLGEARAQLVFATDNPPPYRIEITAEQTVANQFLTLFGSCEAESPLAPTFTIDDVAFKREASTRTQGAFDLAVQLPALPEPVRYEGRVELCAGRRGLDGVPVSLRSTALKLGSLPQGISASFNVAIDAERENDRTQEFCTRVIPGEYVVVVTPPASVNCEIFAEKRQIVEPTDDPDALTLRAPAKLNGKIIDSNMLPIANATVDAIALGIDTAAMLAEDDRTVPIYNRSRQTSTDSTGGFSLYVDVGVYDLIVKPPAQSGFAWQFQPGVTVGSARREDFTTRMQVSAPALIEGTLRYAGGIGKASLAGAEVHAYTVEGADTPNARVVEIGHTQADDKGNVMLLISPESQTAW